MRGKTPVNSHLLACALIVLVTVAIYGNSLHGDFIWDDHGLILDHADYLHEWRNIFRALAKPFCGQTAYYRPLLTASFIIDYQLWGTNPFGYHCTNLLLHAANALLLYLFLWKLFRHARLALWAALLFTAHPVQTEAVSWISGRNDVLLTLFSLLVIIIHLCLHDFSGTRRWGAYAAYLGAYACVLLTKESGLILPALIMLIDYFFAQGRTMKIRDYGGIFLVSVLYFVARMNILDAAALHLSEKDVFRLCATAVETYAYYFKMLLLPWSQNAAPEITAPSAGNHLLSYSLFLPVCLLVSALLCIRKLRELSFAIFWVFVSLIPVCGIFTLLVPALEHRLYLGSVGFSMVIPFTVLKLRLLLTGTKQQKLLLCVTPLLIVIYSLKSVSRNAIWRDEHTFWLTTMHSSPRSALVRNNLGIAYAREGAHEQAIEEFKKGLSLYNGQGALADALSRKHYGNIYNNLGRSYHHLLYRYLSNATPEVLSSNGEVILKNLDAEAYRLYALSYACYGSALRIDPVLADAHTNLGDLFYLMKQYRQADKEYQAALKLKSEMKP